jgi:hypothetical protein
MSFRNPFITSFIYNAEEAKKVKDALAVVGDCHSYGEHVFYGVWKTGAFGTVPTEMRDRVEEALKSSAVYTNFDIFVAGETTDDQVILRWDGRNVHVRFK